MTILVTKLPAALLATLLALAAALLPAGCGGVGSEGTGDAPAIAFASGPITGFGSIVVGGVHYDESAATVRDDDGAALDRAALALGMVVDVEATAPVADADGTLRAVASSVTVRRALLGAVTSSDAGGVRLAVLGQTVQIAADTVLDARFGGRLPAPGQTVEVHGLWDPSLPGVRATRLAPAAASATWRVRGPVGSVDAAQRTLAVGGQTYRIADASVPADAAVGRVVDLKLAPQSAPDGQGRWPVSGRGGDGGTPSDRERATLRGIVATASGARSFTVQGVAVDASAATITGGTPAPGAKVQVEGTLSAGVLRAASVVVEDAGTPRELEVRGRVASIAADGASLVVVDDAGRATTVGLGRADLVFEKGGRGDVRVGVTLRVRGLADAARTGIDAQRIRIGG